jgi:hypothetical protein
MSYFSQQASAYLPQQVNDLMLRGKSIAIAKLSIVGQRTIVAMPRIQVYFSILFFKKKYLGN